MYVCSGSGSERNKAWHSILFIARGDGNKNRWKNYKIKGKELENKRKRTETTKRKQEREIKETSRICSYTTEIYNENKNI